MATYSVELRRSLGEEGLLHFGTGTTMMLVPIGYSQRGMPGFRWVPSLVPEIPSRTRLARLAWAATTAPLSITCIIIRPCKESSVTYFNYFFRHFHCTTARSLIASEIDPDLSPTILAMPNDAGRLLTNLSLDRTGILRCWST